MGGLLLWGGTISIGFSTVVLLAILSRHLHSRGFSNLSTLFGLFFIASLIPSGVPLRAAALVSDGKAPLRMTARHIGMLLAAGAASSPLIAYLLHIPVVAVAFVAAQVIVAIPLVIKRGSLIASERFSALGGNMFLEGGTRILLGTALGLVWGMSGLAAGLALATAVAWTAVPGGSSAKTPILRAMTSMFDTWLTLVLLGVFVQLDILVAPSGLSKAAAIKYDLAAVPSKGVYLVLVAVGTFIFPYIRQHAQRKLIVMATGVTLLLGLAITAILLALRDFTGHVLGQHVSSPFLLLALGAAMSIGGATGVIVNGDIALGAKRPWPPFLLGIAAIMACWSTGPSPRTFALTVLAAQGGVMIITLTVCMVRRHHQRPTSEQTPLSAELSADSP